MRADLIAAALRQLADALEAAPVEPVKRKRGRPKKPVPTVTSGDKAALEAMGIQLTEPS